MRQPRIGGAHRRDQRIDHFALDPVRQMPIVGDVGEAAPAVGDFLVLGERVGDKREFLHVTLERMRQRLCRRLALFPRPVLQEIERRLDGQSFSLHLEAQIGDGRIELPIPGGIGGH